MIGRFIKYCFVVLITTLTGIPLLKAQSKVPTIQWQRCFGGTYETIAKCIVQTRDGGYVVAGYTNASDGDVTVHHGGQYSSDVWIVKLDSKGNMAWQKSYGGTGTDYAQSIQQTADGGYVVAGSTGSSDGDVTKNHGNSDVWILKLDSLGNLSWQKSFGGSANDVANSIYQTKDGGYIVAGSSQSTDGDVVGHYSKGLYSSNFDVWILKLDKNGNLAWQKCHGGTGDEEAQAVQITNDGGYVVTGYTNSYDGEVVGLHYTNIIIRYPDCWVMKLDTTGNIAWQRCLGGNFGDISNDIQQTKDGGFIIAGAPQSANGDVSGLHGTNGWEDYWLAKMNKTGSLQWQKCLGGSNQDIPYSIKQTKDNGYIVSGKTLSSDGDVSGFHTSSFADYWLAKTDSTGKLLWQKCLGGTGEDDAYSVLQTTDGSYIVAGGTSSNDGDVVGLKGAYSFWIVKLSADTVLPVTLSGFNALPTQSDVLVNWQTASETNMLSFVIQRSPNGNRFIDIGNVCAAGNARGNYSFTDYYPISGSNYYRLKMIDKDGTYTYSSITKVMLDNPLISVSPNPTKDMVTIRGNNILKIVITDLGGKTVATPILNYSTISSISLGHLANGVYQLSIVAGDGNVYSKKIIKE